MTVLHEQANATVTATGRTRTNLALHHLFAACRFSTRVGLIETENAGQPIGPFCEEILHNSIGVATLTVAALESYANEMYFEGAILKTGLNSAAASELAEIVDREDILRKYAIAHSISAGKRLQFGIAATENADALIKLRNAIIHFRPEWIDEQNEHEKLSKVLRYKFIPSVCFPNESIFPRAWASHSFTVWALQSTVTFIDHFYSGIGLTSPIEQFRARLSELSSGAL
jgi:hypothetical protein